MKTVSHFIIIAFLICVTSVLAPAVAKSDLKESKEALAQLSKGVRFFKLPNGLRVILYRRGVAPVFSGTVSVRVGGSDEKEGQTGISHMFEHMAFKGTTTLGTKNYGREKELLEQIELFESERAKNDGHLSKDAEESYKKTREELKSLWVVGEFSQQYEKRGATGMNATTDNELTRYFVELPRTAFEWWCAIESERLLHPVMRQFYEERDIVMEERRMRVEDQPEGKLYELLLGGAYQQHSYRHPVIGYSNDIRKLTASRVDAFRREYYTPSNIVVSIVGDVDPDTDIKTIEKYFGQLEVAPPVVRPGVVEPAQEGERRVLLESRASPEVYIAYHKPSYPEHDDAVISMFAQVFAGSQLSPLYTELVKKTQRASAISNEEAPGSAYPNLLVFSLTPRSPSSADDVIATFDSVLRRFKESPVSEDALLRAKRSIAMSFVGEIKNSTELALTLASSELFYNNWNAQLDWYEQAMAVTPEDIQRVASKYFVEGNRTVAIIQKKQ